MWRSPTVSSTFLTVYDIGAFNFKGVLIVTSSNVVNLALPIPIKMFALKLLSWSLDNKCGLPCLNNPSPYNIWVSEIMLQQSQVKTARRLK